MRLKHEAGGGNSKKFASVVAVMHYVMTGTKRSD
jgi:hypothetical protein